MNEFEREIAALAAQAAGLAPERVERFVGAPRDLTRYTYALPCFAPAKEAGLKPVELAQKTAAALSESPLFELAEATGPFVNARVDPAAFARSVLARVACAGDRYGCSDEGQGRHAVIDFSSPNVAKRFHIGHLRSTVIGAAIYRLLEAQGYRAVGVNHLGDWGTQFGHVLSAWRRWGDEAELEKDPLGHLQELYVRHNKAAKEDPSYGDAARDLFKRLEDGDEQARAEWKRFVDLSLTDFNRVYELIGVSFDEVLGESFYADKTDAAIEKCHEKGIASVSEGALVIDLKSHGAKIEEPLLLKRSDGATLYATRDVAAGIYRFEKYDPAFVVYVVGQEQRLAMNQLFHALGLLGYDSSRCHHIWFGRVLGMSSRAGTAVLLDEVLGKSMDLARAIVLEKNPDIDGEELEHVVRAVGIGAVVFADLKNGLKKDFKFDWDRIVQFKGETGPYLQYSHARLSSILRKLEELGVDCSGEVDPSLLGEPETQAVLKAIDAYPERVRRAALEFEPAVLAHHLLELASAFNGFYRDHRVKDAPTAELRLARARLIAITRATLGLGLRLLGITPLERM